MAEKRLHNSPFTPLDRAGQLNQPAPLEVFFPIPPASVAKKNMMMGSPTCRDRMVDRGKLRTRCRISAFRPPPCLRDDSGAHCADS